MTTTIHDCIVAHPKCIAWIKEQYKDPTTKGVLNLPIGTALELIENRYAPVYKDGHHEGMVFIDEQLVATIKFPVKCSLEVDNE